MQRRSRQGTVGGCLAKVRGWRSVISWGVGCVVCAVWVAGSGCALASEDSTGGAVATVQGVATEAGLEALRAGGNAIDAAVAAALMLGVVDGHNSGIGGGCFALVCLANGRTVAVDGRETAPEAATRDMFVRDGKADSSLSQLGALAVGVPGELAALELLARRWGRLPLSRALTRAAEVAENGFVITPHHAARLKGEATVLREFTEAAAIFLRADGTPWRAGELLRQPDLARTYRAIAEEGTDWFYGGEFARRLGQWMAGNGGILSRRDLRRYKVRLREPVQTTYRGFTVLGFPPPSSGGVHVAQILNILEQFDVPAWRWDSAELAHLLAEAMKLAFADRAHWLGDPEYARVPRGLVSKTYAEGLAKRISMTGATEVRHHGEPPRAERDVFRGHTTHLSAADGEGNWIALTATINTTFGSKVVVPGTGVVLNNQMDDFAAQPGVTNFFGLPGADANAVAPGKRPLSSMSPTLVLWGGQPVLAVGAAGGPTIISQTVRAVVNTLDFGMSAGEAIAAPRIHHQWLPDEVVLEEGWPGSVDEALTAKGHRVRRVKTLGAAQAVGLGAGGAGWAEAADPRVGGVAGSTP